MKFAAVSVSLFTPSSKIVFPPPRLIKAPSVVDVTLERTLAAVSIVSLLTFFNTLMTSA